MNEYDWRLVENIAFYLGMVQLLLASASWLVLHDTGILIWSIVVLAFALYLSTYAHVKRVVEKEKDEEMLKEARREHPPEEREVR
jgi:Ca2+/Na+ antiporter